MESSQQPLPVNLFKSDPVVLNRDLAPGSIGVVSVHGEILHDTDANLNLGRHISAVKLQRVANEVLKQLSQLDRITREFRGGFQ